MASISPFLAKVVTSTLLILILCPQQTAVRAAKKKPSFCNNRGIYNAAIRKCECIPNWTGNKCDKRMCPGGFDWFASPHADHKAHKGGVECSGAGDCDRLSGTCTCKFGFEGSACEIMSCPKGFTNSTTITETAPCSGHGRCMSLLEASREWTGVDTLSEVARLGWGGLVKDANEWNSLIKQGSYGKWDGNQIHGCVCDKGYTGFNCSEVECPWGLDDSTQMDKYGLPIHNEVMRFECAATGGTFRFTFRGETTRDIDYDAPIGKLKYIIEELSTVKKISMSMSGSTVCGSSYNSPVETTIQFEEIAGKLPPAKVTPHSNLKLQASDPRLSMITRTLITCPKMWVGPDQLGGMYLKYDGETTRLLNFTDSVLSVESALRNLTSLRHNSDYGHVNVTASTSTGGQTVCSLTSDTNTTIDLRSQFGNLHEIEVIDSMMLGNKISNFTTVVPQATSKILPCSGRGFCEETTGTCECYFKNGIEGSSIFHRYESSDGSLRSRTTKGTKGDCGYTEVAPRKCPGGLISADDLTSFRTCHNNGFCDNSTYTCKCSDGYRGGDCSLRSCPVGLSWFDQMKGDKYAHHSYQECSGQGKCVGESGSCVCRAGFTGDACDKIACGGVNGVMNDHGCGETGSCEPLHQLAQYSHDNGHPRSIPYGHDDPNDNYRDTWDRDMIQSCLCDGGNIRGVKQGPADTYISGIYVNRGFTQSYHGYACHLANCPWGDDPETPGVSEEQLIKCNSTSGTFAISFRGEKTAPIAYDATATQVKSALELLTTVETATVTFLDAAACAASPNGFKIKFDGNGGDLPNVVTSPSFLISEAVKGTTDFLECSGRGSCFSQKGKPMSGMCDCDDNYMSSNGAGSRGIRRDCGAYDETMTAKGFFTT